MASEKEVKVGQLCVYNGVGVRIYIVTKQVPCWGTDDYKYAYRVKMLSSVRIRFDYFNGYAPVYANAEKIDCELLEILYN